MSFASPVERFREVGHDLERVQEGVGPVGFLLGVEVVVGDEPDPNASPSRAVTVLATILFESILRGEYTAGADGLYVFPSMPTTGAGNLR